MLCKGRLKYHRFQKQICLLGVLSKILTFICDLVQELYIYLENIVSATRQNGTIPCELMHIANHKLE